MIVINCFDNQGIPAVVPDDQIGQHDLFLTLIKKRYRRIGVPKQG